MTTMNPTAVNNWDERKFSLKKDLYCLGAEKPGFRGRDRSCRFFRHFVDAVKVVYSSDHESDRTCRVCSRLCVVSVTCKPLAATCLGFLSRVTSTKQSNRQLPADGRLAGCTLYCSPAAPGR